jgi:hypothetical protein
MAAITGQMTGPAPSPSPPFRTIPGAPRAQTITDEHSQHQRAQRPGREPPELGHYFGSPPRVAFADFGRDTIDVVNEIIESSASIIR